MYCDSRREWLGRSEEVQSFLSMISLSFLHTMAEEMGGGDAAMTKVSAEIQVTAKKVPNFEKVLLHI